MSSTVLSTSPTRTETCSVSPSSDVRFQAEGSRNTDRPARHNIKEVDVFDALSARIHNATHRQIARTRISFAKRKSHGNPWLESFVVGDTRFELVTPTVSR